MKTPTLVIALIATVLSSAGLQARPGYNDYTPAPTFVPQSSLSVSNEQPNCRTMTVTTTPKQGGFTRVACGKHTAKTSACRTACERKSS